ncbi:MAG: BON domain-containing protein [Legionella sp.]
MPTLLQLTFIVSLFCLSAPQAANLKKIEQNISDSVITAKITAKFAKYNDLNLLNISVSTQYGKVKLSGHVRNKKAFVAALRLAKDTKGVVGIDADNLDIKLVNSSFTDAYITAKVESAILKAKVLDDESIPLVGISASTSNGVVCLAGTLANEKAVFAILKRVNAVRGVKKIISNLIVKQR